MQIKNNQQIENIIFSFLDKYKILLLILVYGFIFLLIGSKLNLSLLFKDTILTGGDSCSWYQVAKHLKEHLIPHGRLFGWSLANFFGYNEQQFYFTIPFLFSVILSLFMPLTIALKITTLIGIFVLPIAFYYSVEKITKNYWAGLMASCLSLLFIFNESYTMFGGNFLSTFAGEFCYSFSMTIFVFFVGVCYDCFQNNKSPILSGILLGLIGLSHIFVFMPAFFVPFFFIFIRYIKKIYNFRNNIITKKIKNKQDKENIKNEILFPEDKVLEKILFIYIIAFIVMSFWLLPMIMTRYLSQSISMIWHFASLKDFFNQTFFGIIFLGFMLAIFVLINTENKKENIIFPIFILYFYLVCAFFYIISIFLEIPDIRFVPPAIIISIFSLSLFANFIPEYFFENKYNNYVNVSVLILIMIGISFFVFKYPKNVVSWYNWNYSGYEAKKEWINLKRISENYKGTINSGRILWEKQNQNDNADFGSERGFENLYLFTGRPSTEGIHYGSSFQARAITYMQSEYSQNPVDPEANRIYSKINPDSWPTRFFQTNSKDIILYSDELKRLFASHPDFYKSNEFGKFHIYTYKKFPKSYIEIRDFESIKTINDNKYGFKTDFYRYFRDYELIETPFIPKKYIEKDKIYNFENFENYDYYRAKYFNPDYSFNEWLNNYKYKESIEKEDITHFTIKFKTKEIGKPHIIKITYSPNFKSKNGEKIYPISPGFMMMIPSKENVEIYYGWNIYEIIGLIITLLLIPVIIFRKKIDLVSLPYKEILRNIALTIFFSLVIFFLFVSIFSIRTQYSDLKKGEYYYNNRSYLEALNIANKYATIDNLDKYDNALIYNYFLLKAKTLYELGEKQQSKETFEYILNRYNHSRLNDNTLYYYKNLKF